MANLSPEAYQRHKAAAAARINEMTRMGQDIGELPPVVDPLRKSSCKDSFRVFCETYLAGAFGLDWSHDHLKCIGKIDTAVRTGGLFALAMPRGSGKTTLCQSAVLWASLYGFSRYVVLIAASADRARTLLENIKVWLETNELLKEDFPEVTFPIEKLDRIASRQKGQKYNGESTRIEWNSDRIVYPYIPGSDASGCCISCSGLKGSEIRGLNYSRPDGEIVRPDLVLIDDPQTTDSAWSVSQSFRREAILAGDVLGMAGPGKKISGLCACTVIRRGDMADAILDRDKHPEWHGERTKMVYKFPTSDLWTKYAEIRADELKNDGDGSKATEFYRLHQKEMDAGAEVAWPQRKNEDELTALQHAMNLKFRDEPAFFAEYQNEPMQEVVSVASIDPEELMQKINHLEQGTAPSYCEYLTGFIDVHKDLLYWIVCGWRSDFTGAIIDYGCYPDQGRPYYTLSSARPTLSDLIPGAGLEASVLEGLQAVTSELFTRLWPRSGGGNMQLDLCFIDAGWGQTTDLIYSHCHTSEYNLMPSHGKFIGASGKPFSEYTKKNGDRVGLHWRSPAPTERRGMRHIVVDTNYWKSFVVARLRAAAGDAGSIMLPGKSRAQHRLLCEHFAAEFPVPVEVAGGGRKIEEWKQQVGRPDNHFFDCLVGCAVAASYLGVGIKEIKTQQVKERVQRLSFAQIQQAKERGWRR